MQNTNQGILKFVGTRLSRQYGSNIYLKKKDKTSRLQFKTNIVYAGIFMQQYYIYHIHKHGIYLDEMIPDDHSYRLAYECSKVFYPLVVFCSQEGELIGLRNDILKARWKKMKPLIEREFIGKSAEDYIRRTENNINHPEHILNLLRKDLFIHTFFSLKYGGSLLEEIIIKQEYPLIAFENPFQGVGSQMAVIESNNLSVVQKGDFVEEPDRFFNYGDVLNTIDYAGGSINGKFDITYELGTNLIIDAIHADFSLKKQDGSDLMDIKMESYYLQESPLRPIVDQDTINLGIQIEKDTKKINKKSLWERFNNYLNEPL